MILLKPLRPIFTIFVFIVTEVNRFFYLESGKYLRIPHPKDKSIPVCGAYLINHKFKYNIYLNVKLLWFELLFRSEMRLVDTNTSCSTRYIMRRWAVYQYCTFILLANIKIMIKTHFISSNINKSGITIKTS